MEGKETSSLQSYDSLAYYVNNVGDLDPSVVSVHKDGDAKARERLLAEGKNNFDVFVCINRHAHAFILCVPVGESDIFPNMFKDDPVQVPDLILCWRFELCFENQQLRTYKIRKDFSMFKNIQPGIKTSFYIGRYKDVSPKAFQFAALRAAPHRYNAILNDCVEFAKEFCVAMLSYCSNWRELEEEVNKRIREASATGLSVERLSRNVQSSGWLGNTFLAGIDFSAVWGSGRYRGYIIAGVVLFLLVYPIVIAFLVALFIKWLG